MTKRTRLMWASHDCVRLVYDNIKTPASVDGVFVYPLEDFVEFLTLEKKSKREIKHAVLVWVRSQIWYVDIRLSGTYRSFVGILGKQYTSWYSQNIVFID